MGWGSAEPARHASGAVILALSFVLFVVERRSRALRHGEVAGDNPWDAGTLEWATTSPPPPYNFGRIPLVTSREPLWAERQALAGRRRPARRRPRARWSRRVTRRARRHRARARPSRRSGRCSRDRRRRRCSSARSSRPGRWCGASIPVAIALDRLVLAEGLEGGRGVRPQRIVEDVSALPTYAFGPRMTMWWGTLGFCALEGMGFALAIGAYLYLVQVNPQWPLADIAAEPLARHARSRHPPREHLAELPGRAPRQATRTCAAVRRDLVIMSRRRRGAGRDPPLRVHAAQRALGPERLRLDRSGSCSGCTPPTSSPTSATRWC